ncbi:MFS transporter [Ferrimonas futtsuensis]|uniref:MFS transporter n=1 Tax=Ferrimonas futtsuensis TaxID=364764 RepID=UPI000404139B|nr:MFS transporter [Ferrimonas futtsuensis]
MTESVLSRKGSGVLAPIGGLFLFAVATGYLMSILPLSVAGLSMPAEMAAWLASALYAGLLLGALCVEPLITRLGHRPALMLSLLVLSVTVAVMAALPHPLLWLAMRLLAGVATAGVFVVIESWLLLVEDERQRAGRLGLYMAALYGGNALGQLMINLLGVGGAWPLLVVMGLMLLAAVPPLLSRAGVVSPLGAECHSEPVSLRSISMPAVLGCVISGLVLGPLYGLMPVFLDQQESVADLTGVMMALVVLGGMAVQPLGSWMSARVGKTLLMALFSLAGVMAAVILVLASTPLEFGLGMLLLGASAFVLYPVAINQACEGRASAQIVRITQLMLISYSLGSVAGPLLVQAMAALAIGLLQYLGIVFLATSLYMLVSALRRAPALLEPPAGME